LDSKALRLIVVFGLIGTLLLTLMMMFTLNQVADTETPQIADDASKEFAPSLAEGPEPAVKLTMTRDGTGPSARRVYKLRLRASAEVAADKATLASLMYHASEFCAGQIADAPSDVAIRCVAELPDGGTKETIFMRDRTGAATGIIHEVAELPPLPADEASKR
jgi:hypothetical protein